MEVLSYGCFHLRTDQMICRSKKKFNRSKQNRNIVDNSIVNCVNFTISTKHSVKHSNS